MGIVPSRENGLWEFRSLQAQATEVLKTLASVKALRTNLLSFIETSLNKKAVFSLPTIRKFIVLGT